MLLSELRLKDALICRAWPGKLSLQEVLALTSIQPDFAGKSGLSLAAAFLFKDSERAVCDQWSSMRLSWSALPTQALRRRTATGDLNSVKLQHVIIWIRLYHCSAP